MYEITDSCFISSVQKCCVQKCCVQELNTAEQKSYHLGVYPREKSTPGGRVPRVAEEEKLTLAYVRKVGAKLNSARGPNDNKMKYKTKREITLRYRD